MPTTYATITELKLFPVKSLAGIKVKSATLTTQGLAFDRHWMVSDANYRFVTQRQLREMALIKVELNQSELILSKQGLDDLTISLQKQPSKQVKATVWRDEVKALDEGDQAAQWLTKALGLYNDASLRLLRFDKTGQRQVDKNFLPSLDAGYDAHTEFSDGFPYLICNTASLDHLNQTLLKNQAEQVDMQRFRANIVVTGLNAWQEYNSETCKEANGFYQLSLRKPCQRCPITQITPETAEVLDKKEPLLSLSEINPLPNLKGAYFGQNAILVLGENETITVGDRLSLI